MDLAKRLTAALGPEVQDADEETFLLFALPPASRNLGFVDPRASSVCVSLAGRDVTVHQSPAVLSSSRARGTTGAVLWRVTPELASWFARPDNPLLALILPSANLPAASVLELGCGISHLNALALRSRAANHVLSDQPYVQRFIAQNLADAGIGARGCDQADASRRRGARPRKHAGPLQAGGVCFRPLDWEMDAVTPALAAPGRDFDAVLSCDCVYNEALVAPLVQTCADACALRRDALAEHQADGDDDVVGGGPCVCIVAQQLRSDDVFLAWLTAFQAAFRVWRVPSDMLPEELRPEAGFVIHVGILKE
ncbi:hypothetical protein HIM_02609 [Hirsutella minnesotensis 3608]|nr:hypothetical protein HIM_02609 [Hirsutella minnesotensis 3608]